MKRRAFIRLTLPLAIVGRLDAEPAVAAELSFGVIADPQYADAETAGTRFYRKSLGKLETAIQDLNRHELAYVTTLGDLIDRDLMSFDAVMPIYDKLRHPHFPICGNHDFSVEDADKSKVLEKLKLPSAYYSKSIAGWRCIFLDGTDVAVYRHPSNDTRTAEARKRMQELKQAGKTQAQEWNGGIGPEQMVWLEKELVAAREARQRVILFNHYPVFPAGGYNLWNADELLELIGKNDLIVAYMNGHKHAGNYATHQGCHFLNFKGMVETENDTAYAIVRCFPDRLEIEGYGQEPDRKLGKL